ncbi:MULTISPECIES: hypothetical protein [unclassified Salipiger]|uniref:hypothetical protein n=1 Tax=unclassified Salipiger TaxID=2640570 RepID=UPI0013B6700C|nr:MULTISPECIES: hypothetical protein [unclassified Salipiger]NDV48493.1 hypothetical protein [Salipiger sp. PrR003]NDW35310.1 hypothetical protein [Salipiger sp. PrR007]
MTSNYRAKKDKIETKDLATHQCRACLMCADPERRRCARDRMRAEGIGKAEIDHLQLSNKSAH